ncbi:MAG: chemotaxis protein CheW [Rhodocyclaceae bacterium]|nr:chemotaxis protein CheW [Rhodocyclaceae bacterium]MDZ4214241.1 chemotaxis protein CheW [Rhodocyclaceae bacterium]
MTELVTSPNSTVARNGSGDGQSIEMPDDQTDKLNLLIDLVGELVIASASASLLSHKSGQTALAEANSVVSQLVESIRDAALQLRMVKIGASFERIQGAAHDDAKQLGKDVEISLSGIDTELDKSVVDKVSGPLLHLVRHTLAHGIEPAEGRLSQDKPAIGRIELKAYHDSASIVIEVIDDGAGLDLKAIQAEAIEKGLLQPEQLHPETPDDEIIKLIFEPGMQGGMDEVQKCVAALRGAVSVSTTAGAGTCFSIRLPLTLAIIDGFLTGVANSSYVIPLDAVVECLELANINVDRDYINLRGEVLPYVRLREIFEVPGEQPTRENVVVVQYAGQKAGIVVDQLLGEFQTVIKPLSALFRHIQGIGGSTILGSGEVALILDVQALITRCARSEEQQARLTESSDLHRHEMH